jgi:enoyl-CoA hydratase/carnithine racemase
MESLSLQRHGAVAEIALSRPKVNAISAEMLAGLRAALDAVRGDAETRAVVLSSGVPRFFSAGFDVKQIFCYGPEELAAFLRSAGRLFQELHRFPKPAVAAVSGHAIGGGAILSLCCDFRVMAEGDAGFALNEINLGVALPPFLYQLLARAAGDPLARRMLLTGDPITPTQGLDAGLFYQVVPENHVREAALALAQRLAGKPPQAFARIKSVIGVTQEEEWTDASSWFTPEAIEGKQRLVAALEKK